MQYFGHIYTKNQCCLSDIQLQLGVLCFIWQPHLSTEHRACGLK